MPFMTMSEVLAAPTQLVAHTRLAFRRAALEEVERSSLTGATTVVIDLSGTQEIDASGLGILVLVQKRAKEMGLVTRLINTNRSVRHLLTLTKLEYLFEVQGQAD
jgi:anti-anti-sigma factor